MSTTSMMLIRRSTFSTFGSIRGEDRGPRPDVPARGNLRDPASKAKLQMVFQDPTEKSQPALHGGASHHDPILRLGPSLPERDMRARW